jgi:uncharacterized ubiquitin-like protein YukD
MLKESIINYLQKQSYNINISNNSIYINNYSRIDTINEQKLIIIIDNLKINITGKEFKAIRLLNKEVLFKGNIESINFKYD